MRAAGNRLNFEHHGWLLVIPGLVVLAVVIIYPVLRAVQMSLQRDRSLDPTTGKFVQGGWNGVQNYVTWLTQRCPGRDGLVSCPPGLPESQFWGAVSNTLLLTVITVVLEIVIGLWMAVIMGKTFWGRSLLRAAVLIPWAIPTAVTAKLWYFMFAPDGIVNSMFGTTILWTAGGWPSRFAVIVSDVWKTTPFMALLILAGLQMIPNDVYEAARMDGANAWQRFVRITLPLIKPALMVAILFRVMDALRMYDLPRILVTGNTESTRTVSILVVDQIRQGEVNSAAALSTITFLMIFAIAFLLIKMLGAQMIDTGDDKPGKAKAQDEPAKVEART
nr:sugar ABC transporter permease [Millisia brevis]